MFGREHPCSARDDAKVRPVTSESSSSGKPRVLVVDDRAENLFAMEALLSPLGSPVVAVRSGPDALRALLKEDFAVVLMDVQMPGMDGLETASLIRGREKSATLPILFMTAETQQKAKALQAYKLGAVDFLVKPVDPTILLAKVGFFVELYERGEVIRRQELELVERRRAELESKRASELEKQILGIVGHDIRGPLSAILATAQVQLKAKNLPDGQAKALQRIERSTVRIQKIVDDLLDFTRARVGKGIPLEKSEVCLVELIQRLLDESTAVNPDREFRFVHHEATVPGLWDAGRLSQVFANLLDNAVKYSPPKSPIDVVLQSAPDQATLEVRNGGSPIPAQKLAMLFEPFSRGEDSGTHARTSLGLGLFIVREIVRRHEGTVEVASDAEAGTRFKVTLPRHAVSSSSSAGMQTH